MRVIFVLVLLLSQTVWAAEITANTLITCISGESGLIGRRTASVTQGNADDSETRVTEWVMKESFGDAKSKIKFFWTPRSDQGPKITLETTDKPHNLIKIRSRTKSSLIVVTSTSNFYSAESWTFAINFNLETMIANRVTSNGNGVGSEQIVYSCLFEPLG